MSTVTAGHPEVKLCSCTALLEVSVVLNMPYVPRLGTLGLNSGKVAGICCFLFLQPCPDRASS